MKKFLALVLSMLMLVTVVAFAGCDEEEAGIKQLNEEQLTQFNQAVTQTNDYNGSFTIKERMTASASGGGVSQSRSVSADVAYNSQTKQNYYFVDMTDYGSGKLLVYSLKNQDETYTQYVNSGYSKYANDYESEQDIKANGYKTSNFYSQNGKYVNFVFDGLGDALNQFLATNLNELENKTTLQKYYDFWSSLYKSRMETLATQFNLTLNYSNGNSSLKGNDNQKIYTFTVLAKSVGSVNYSGIKISGLNVTLTVQVKVQDGLLVQTKSTVKAALTASYSGQTESFTGNSVCTDDFIYSYDNSLTPTEEQLSQYIR